MRVLIAGERAQDLDQCRRAALRVGLDCGSADCVCLADLRFRLSRDPEVHFVVVYTAPDADAATRAIKAATNHSPRPVFAIAENEPTVRTAVVEAGAAGVWEVGQEKDALLAAAEGLRQNGVADYRRGRLITVTAAQPGVGVTTITTGLAFALGRAGPTILTELWGGVPELALDLDLAPQPTLGDLIRESHRADPSMIRHLATSDPAGIDVLAYPPETLAAEPVSVEASRDFQILLRSMYDWVLADAGAGPGHGAEHLIRHSEVVVLVTRLDPPSLRLTRRYARFLTDAGVDRDAILIVANRYGQAGQVAWRKVEESLNRPVIAWLPDDARATNRALGTGRPLSVAAPRSRLARGLGRLAEELRRRRRPPGEQPEAGPQRRKRQSDALAACGVAAPRTPSPYDTVGTPMTKDRHSSEPFNHRYHRLKTEIHRRIVETLDLSKLNRWDLNRIRREVRALATHLCSNAPELLNEVEREQLTEEVMSEVFGLGPLDPLMGDPSISDILVNGPHSVYVERNGKLELTNVRFYDNAHLLQIVQRVAARVGRRADEMSPMVDARLEDGSRVNAIIPPLALTGPVLSIRRFGVRLGADELMANKTMPAQMVEFLKTAVESRISVLVSGGTGSGKTTLLNALSAFIPGEERLITIEDSAELKLRQKHVVSLETRMSNVEGAGEIRQRELVRNVLRMRPDRIIVGEVRGGEALDMLQAMNTGHEGSLTTIHANDTKDALTRLEMMVMMAGFELPVAVIRQYIATAITLVVQLARLKGGKRKVVRVSEVCGLDPGPYDTHDVFGYRQHGVRDGMAFGEFYATGYRPKMLEKFRAMGLELSEDLFEKQTWRDA